jgi:hypothetical protein
MLTSINKMGKVNEILGVKTVLTRVLQDKEIKKQNNTLFDSTDKQCIIY